MPNLRLLSAIDLFSHMADGLAFAPTDLARIARFASRPADDALTIRLFLTGIGVLVDNSAKTGLHLVLRDHSHNKVCFGPLDLARLSLRAVLVRRFSHVGIVKLCHPLDSLLALTANNWQQFQPFMLNDYACLSPTFLDEHDDLPMFPY